jgi:hypothetical protein
MLKILYTNMRWSFSMRGDPADCAFLKSALPVTGRLAKPRGSPFEDTRFYTPADERSLALEAVSRLTDRAGWLWFKALAGEAVAMRTRELRMPSGPELEAAVARLRNDPGIGMRTVRQQYEEAIAARDRQWAAGEPTELSASFHEAYQRVRGEEL